MMRIYDGRKEFYQWDLDQKLIVTDPDITEVHYFNHTTECAPVCEVYEEDGQRFVNVPNIFLQSSLPIKAYSYAGCFTKSVEEFTVKSRAKPEDYVYTETEVKRWDELYERLDELELGARAIVDVEVLPTEDINTALLYRVPEGVFWYDGAWHKVIDASEIAKINAEIAEVENIAKGAGQAVSFGNYETMITAFNALPTNAYKVGQNVMIVTVAVPDLWISGISHESTEYTYTDDATIVEALKTNGSIKVGHYTLSQLETQKVDLTEYVKFTDEPGNTAAGGKPGVIGLNYATSCGLRIVGSTGKRYLTVHAGEENDWLRRNGNCVLVVSNLDPYIKIAITGKKRTNVNGEWVDSYGNQRALTDEEKASALAWLGAVGFTNYAGEGVAGLIKTSNQYSGCFVDANGTLKFYGLADGEWDDRNRYGYYASNRVIKADMVDMAVKVGLTKNSKSLTAEEQVAAQKWLGLPHIGDEVEAEYSCESYPHFLNNAQVIISGAAVSELGLATTEVISLDDLGAYTIDYESGKLGSLEPDTKSLNGERVEIIEGGYVLRVSDECVIVVTNRTKFNQAYNMGLSSNGTYLCRTQYDQMDSDGYMYTYESKVTKLSKYPLTKYDNKYLALEQNAVIKALTARIKALENK